MPHEPNLAVLENRVNNMEATMHILAEVQQMQTKVNGNLEKTIALLQQSHETFMAETKPKVTELWENRSQIKGGYILIAMLGAMIVGAATVGGVIFEIYKH